MKRALFSPKAENDLDEIFHFIASDNSQAGENVRQNILDTADILVRYPELGQRIRHASPRHAQIRWHVVPKFRNYLIFYQPFQKTIMVIRILSRGTGLDAVLSDFEENAGVMLYRFNSAPCILSALYYYNFPLRRNLWN